MKRFAVIISGCGVYDGAEIHETVLTLLAINRHWAKYQLFAPNINQAHVINHLTGEVMPEQRNVLVESARIARGNIQNLADFNPDDFDGLVLPGGFGAAKNLSNYAFKGAECDVEPTVFKAVKQMHTAGKPIGAMCIAPVVIARIVDSVKVTIGDDQPTADHIHQMGGKHIDTIAEEIITDLPNKVFTTPCYMLNSSISEIAIGCDNLIHEMIKHMA